MVLRPELERQRGRAPAGFDVSSDDEAPTAAAGFEAEAVTEAASEAEAKAKTAASATAAAAAATAAAGRPMTLADFAHGCRVAAAAAQRSRSPPLRPRPLPLPRHSADQYHRFHLVQTEIRIKEHRQKDDVSFLCDWLAACKLQGAETAKQRVKMIELFCTLISFV